MAAIIGFQCSDIPELETWRPKRLEDVYLSISVYIGNSSGGAADIFQTLVATPEAIRARMKTHGAALVEGRHSLLVSCYDWNAIREHLEKLVAQAPTTNWERAAGFLSRHLLWEFEDYTLL